jgi:sugar/nucleoside kinase (ribokinase family)
MFLSIGSIIIDDIVLPDGRTFMGTLGGGTTHAAMGMRVWSKQVRPVAAVGRDLPPTLGAQLAEMFDTRALLLRSSLPTPRAWQLFEADGRRTEIFRSNYADFLATFPLPEEYPLDLLHASGVHLQGGIPAPFQKWVQRLRAAGQPFILWEPWDQFCENPENYPDFEQMAAWVDAVSPNLSEGQALTGLSEPTAVLRRLLQSAPLVALRMGSKGSLVAQRGGPILSVKAAPVTEVIDQTGAGNAFCGGLIAGMCLTGELATAAKYAAVSASFALGQFGAVYPLEGIRQKALNGLDQIEIGIVSSQ